MVVSDESSTAHISRELLREFMCMREQTLLVILERLLKVGEVALLVRTRDGAHALHVAQLCVLGSQLDRKKRCDIFRLRANVCQQ